MSSSSTRVMPISIRSPHSADREHQAEDPEAGPDPAQRDLMEDRLPARLDDDEDGPEGQDRDGRRGGVHVPEPDREVQGPGDDDEDQAAGGESRPLVAAEQRGPQGRVAAHRSHEDRASATTRPTVRTAPMAPP